MESFEKKTKRRKSFAYDTVGENSEMPSIGSTRTVATDSGSATWGFLAPLAALVETDRPPGKIGAIPACNPASA